MVPGGILGGVVAVAMGWGPHELRPFSVCPAAPPMLYPNLAELENYMGLALSSEEIQKNLLPECSTVGVWAGDSRLSCAELPMCHSIAAERGGSPGTHPARRRDAASPCGAMCAGPCAPASSADSQLHRRR